MLGPVCRGARSSGSLRKSGKGLRRGCAVAALPRLWRSGSAWTAILRRTPRSRSPRCVCITPSSLVSPSEPSKSSDRNKPLSPGRSQCRSAGTEQTGLQGEIGMDGRLSPFTISVHDSGDDSGGRSVFAAGTVRRYVPVVRVCVSEIRTYSPLPCHAHYIAVAPILGGGKMHSTGGGECVI